MTRHPTRLTIFAAALALASTAGPSQAQSPEAAEIRALKQQLDQSMKMIQDLAAKVQQLERSAAAREPEGSATQQARIDALQEQVNQLGSGLSRRTGDGIPVHGFADVGYVSSNADRDNLTGKRGNKGFGVGSFDLYLTPTFGGRVKSLVELVFEVDDAGELHTDLERVQVGYTFSDALTVWAGRFHTPYGYWNTAFHHGAQIQTSILRPRFLDFEDKGGILPAHLTGLWLTGAFGTGAGKVSYDLYAANSPKILGATAPPFAAAPTPPGPPSGTLDMRMSGNTSSQSTAGFNLGFAPRAVPGLLVGLHGLRGTVEDDVGPPTNRTRLGVFGGYAVYTENDWEVLSEYYRFDNDDRSGGTGSHTSNAWYAQAGRTFGLYTPFARFERTQLDQADNYFLIQENGRSYKRAALGLRYDVDPKAALKFEWLHMRVTDLVPGVGADDHYNEWRLQYAIRF